jgi:type I restriction enzyme M protein
MPAPKPKPTPKPSQSRSPDPAHHLGFEATLWATADKLRGNLDAAEYKHVVLGLIFLKCISDAFEEKHAALQRELGAHFNPRDRKAIRRRVPGLIKTIHPHGKFEKPDLQEILRLAIS